MSDDFKNRRKADRYVKEIFVPAEAHAMTLWNCASWAMLALKDLRDVAERPETYLKGETLPFPDKEMRNFEELGREMDRLFRDVNIKFPKFDDEGAE